MKGRGKRSSKRERERGGKERKEKSLKIFLSIKVFNLDRTREVKESAFSRRLMQIICLHDSWMESAVLVPKGVAKSLRLRTIYNATLKLILRAVLAPKICTSSTLTSSIQIPTTRSRRLRNRNMVKLHQST